MLIELQVENYKSFRDLQRFTVTASSDTSLEENTMQVAPLGKQRVLRSAVIYGANAAGKSNLIHAFDFLRDFVTGRDPRKPGDPIPVQPFRLDAASRNKPSLFEVTFIKDGVRYQYGFRVDRRRVHEEWLYAYPKRTAQQWFRRTQKDDASEAEWYFGPNLRGDKERLAQLTRPDYLFLTSAVQFTQPQLQTVYDWFREDLRVITATELETVSVFDDVTAHLTQNALNASEALRRILQIADLGITDFVTEEKKIDESAIPPHLPEEMRAALMNTPQYVTRLRHRTLEDPQGGLLFSMDEESSGTQRLYRIGGPLLMALQGDWLLAVDELDASLHPQIVRWLVGRFHSKARPQSTAQLIFNTHDTSLLDGGIFRRDQIWFVEKDQAGASHLYSLLEYSPRKGEALGKGYLQGRYGAIPSIGGDWFDGEDDPELAATVEPDYARR